MRCRFHPISSCVPSASNIQNVESFMARINVCAKCARLQSYHGTILRFLLRNFDIIIFCFVFSNFAFSTFSISPSLPDFVTFCVTRRFYYLALSHLALYCRCRISLHLPFSIFSYNLSLFRILLFAIFSHDFQWHFFMLL